jgi:asparagine synthase (glutamine-hydrolysing)
MLMAVKKLEPGHAMILRAGEIAQAWCFYDLPYDQPIQRITEGEATEEVARYIRRAVERQMVADVPVGAFLSGGLDSSAIVAFAREFADDRRLQCFTIGFTDDAARREGMTEDLPYARAVAKHLDVDLHTVTVGADMVDHLEQMIYHVDEPQADVAPLNVLFISRLAREHGIKVLLSGAGGDDIFTGYRRHYALSMERYWSGLSHRTRHAMRSLTARLPAANPRWRRVRKAFEFADLDGDERLASYFLWGDPRNAADLYGPLLKNDRSDPLARLVATLRRSPEEPALNRMLYLEGKHFLVDHNLNYTDKMSMAEGVEVRVPLLDPDVIALAARLPPEYKQRGKIGKWIFKKAMEPYLPAKVIYRPKTGFGAPLRHWLRHELRPVVEDVLSDGALTRRGLFSPRGVRRLVNDDRDGRVDGSYTILSLICIEMWCRIFLDSRATLPRGLN